MDDFKQGRTDLISNVLDDLRLGPEERPFQTRLQRRLHADHGAEEVHQLGLAGLHAAKETVVEKSSLRGLQDVLKVPFIQLTCQATR